MQDCGTETSNEVSAVLNNMGLYTIEGILIKEFLKGYVHYLRDLAPTFFGGNTLESEFTFILRLDHRLCQHSLMITYLGFAANDLRKHIG
jgi:hypothetical protein